MDKKKERKRLMDMADDLVKMMASIERIPAPENAVESKESTHVTEEEEKYINYCVLLFMKNITFIAFIGALAHDFLQLSEEPEKAKEISQDGLDLIEDFLEEYMFYLRYMLTWRE